MIVYKGQVYSLQWSRSKASHSCLILKGVDVLSTARVGGLERQGLLGLKTLRLRGRFRSRGRFGFHVALRLLILILLATSFLEGEAQNFHTCARVPLIR